MPGLEGDDGPERPPDRGAGPERPLERGDGPEVGWGLGDVVAGLLAGIVGGNAAAGVAVAIQGSNRLTLAVMVAGFAGLWGGYLLTIALVSRRRGSGHVAADLRLRLAGPADAAVGALTGLVTGLLLVPALYVALLQAGVIDQRSLDRLSEPAQRLAETARGPGFILLALLVGVLGPLVEECFFRGFMQPAFVRRLGAAPGVGLTALVFAAVHFQRLQFPALFLFGLLLGLLTHRRRRIGPGVVAHMVFNALTLAQLAARQ